MDKKLIAFTLVITLLVISLFSACSTSTSSSTSSSTSTQAITKSITSTNTSDQTTQTNWWDMFGEPEYGGSITLQADNIETGDVHARMGFTYGQGELLFYYNWTTDRSIYPFNTEFVPQEYIIGWLAESWELTNPATLTVKIRHGVYFHDRPPVNGRELTADDVACHFDWILGTGHGYTVPIPQASAFNDTESVTATDRYTVVFKFKPPGGYRGFAQIIFSGETGRIVPIEVEQAGLSFDWKAVNSTGPYILSDYVENVSTTLSRNPDYWGYDERHSDNKLPYIDTIKTIAIPDIATSVAALRTGKIDYLSGSSLTWVQAESLTKTNLDIQVAWLPGNGTCLDMRCDNPPFTDINVRKAMNMAIDRQAIAKSHFGGIVDGMPVGLIAVESGWTTPYSEWPEELKEEYSYNPEKAIEALNNAGYPNGFDTNIYASTSNDIELLQIIKSYLADIGIEMTINTMDPVTYRTFGQTKKHDQMITNDVCGMIQPPPIILVMRTQAFDANKTNNNDPVWEAMVESIANADVNEAKEICVKADLYLLSQHWALQVFETKNPVLYQSYVKGYSGERVSMLPYYWARMWVDTDLKKSMGR